MDFITFAPIYRQYIGTGRILRNVYLTKNVQQCLRTHQVMPKEWIGVPKYMTYKDIPANDEWNIHQMCAVASLTFPTHSLDLIHETAISKLLVGNLLIHFDAEKRVKTNEVVHPVLTELR